MSYLVSKPSRSDATKLATLDVQYEIAYGAVPELKTADDYRKAVPKLSRFGVEGLRTKLHIFQESTGKGGELYTFFTREDLDAYVASELFKGFAQSPFVKKGTLKYLIYENLPGGELCSEMAPWASGSKRPTEADIANSYVFFPHFNVKYGAIKEINSLDDYAKGAGSFATVPWINLKGLRTKWFTMHRESETCHGVYLFTTKAALDAYLASDLFRRFVKQPWLINPDPQVWEVLKGSELTVEMGEYKGEDMVGSFFKGLASLALCTMIDGGLPPKLKPVGSSDGWRFALTEVDADKAAKAKLPVPAAKSFYPLPPKMQPMKQRGFTEYAFVPWATMGDGGAALAPAGAFCFQGPDVKPIWRAMQLTEPHPMGKKMGIPAAAADLTFGGYKTLSLPTQPRNFDDLLAMDPKAAPGVAELQAAVANGVSGFRAVPPFAPFEKYARFAWVGGGPFVLGFAGVAGAFVYELPDDGGLVYHAGTLTGGAPSFSLPAALGKLAAAPGALLAALSPPAPTPPTAKDMVAAHVLYVKLKCDWTGNVDVPDLPALRAMLDAGGATGMWAAVPGLRTKYFTYCEATDTVTGVYVFLTKAALEGYKRSDLFKAHATFKHFSKIEAEVHDVMEGTERSVDLGKWGAGGAGAKPRRADFDGKAYMLHVRLTCNYKGNPDIPNEAAMRYGIIDGPGPNQGFPKMWAAVPGLRSKYFTLTPDAKLCSGFYTFFDKASLDTYVASDLFKMHATFKHFSKIEYTVHEVLAGSERSVDLGAWPGA